MVYFKIKFDIIILVVDVRFKGRDSRLLCMHQWKDRGQLVFLRKSLIRQQSHIEKLILTTLNSQCFIFIWRLHQGEENYISFRAELKKKM